MTPAAALMALLLQLSFLAAAAAQANGSTASYPRSCGNVSVPYPFGIGPDPDCYLLGFNLTCDRTRGQERLLIGGAGATLEVVKISLATSTIRVMETADAVNFDNYSNPSDIWWRGLGADALTSPFVVSATRNRLVVTGCNMQGTLLGEDLNLIAGCSAFCAITDNFARSTSPEDVAACAGSGYYETPIPIGRPSYVVRLTPLDPNAEGYFDVVPIAVRVAETGWFQGASAALFDPSADDSSRRTAFPIVLEWAVNSAWLMF
ncbi:hypothetical protein ACQ4PT_021249 [Festuca glaucescens]